MTDTAMTAMTEKTLIEEYQESFGKQCVEDFLYVLKECTPLTDEEIEDTLDRTFNCYCDEQIGDCIAGIIRNPLQGMDYEKRGFVMEAHVFPNRRELEYFKVLARTEGLSFQALITKALRQYVTRNQQVQ